MYIQSQAMLSAYFVQVPRSSKLIYEDNDYSLYSVTLFKRVADSFKQAARSKGFQVGCSQYLSFIGSLEEDHLNYLYLLGPCSISSIRSSSMELNFKPNRPPIKPSIN